MNVSLGKQTHSEGLRSPEVRKISSPLSFLSGWEEIIFPLCTNTKETDWNTGVNSNELICVKQGVRAFMRIFFSTSSWRTS